METMSKRHKATNNPSKFAATTSSNVFSFTALSSLELISGSPSTLPYRPPSSTIAKAPELGSVVSLRSAFNTTAPANHLPYELVVKILSSGAWSRWRELVALTHICQHWRSVTLGTPQLWGDAVRVVFAGPCRYHGRHEIRWPKCLQVFLVRSEPLPLKINFSNYTHFKHELSPDAVLHPHLPRLTHLSIDARIVDWLRAVLLLVPSHLRNLESLVIPQYDGLGNTPLRLSGDKTPSWDDADLPHLHTLAMPGQHFERALAVPSLKHLILYEAPRSHNVFLAALERCAPALESLTLRDWLHPKWESREPGSPPLTVHLPRLRRLEIASNPRSFGEPPPALLLQRLSFPPDVAIDIGWFFNLGCTPELLPKYVTGLHAPPFFDSMCLRLFRPSPQPLTVSLCGYVGDTERLRVREVPILDVAHHKRHRLGLFGRFPEGHQWPAVTQLAVDLDMEIPTYDWEEPRRALEHLLPAFVRAFPGLRRLDLLGNIVGSARLRMLDAFLDLPPLSVSEPSEAWRTLGYACEVPEHARTMRITGFVDALREQLDALEARLTHHLAQGGVRLHRLELCIAYSSCSPTHPPPRTYPHICRVEPSTVLTAYLSSIYLPRFKVLVEEVVFLGGAQTRVPGYRVITKAERRHLVPGLKPHLAPRLLGRESRRGSSGGRKGR